MRKMIFILGAVLLYAPSVYSDAYIKLVSDKSESDVYVNGDIVGTYYDVPIEFILPPGEYTVEVKKIHKDQSLDYFSRKIKAGKIDTKIAVNAVLKKEYTQDWYYRQANTIKGAQAYLEKFPNTKQSKKIEGFVEMEYARQATSVKGAKAYLDRYPDGRFREAVLNRTIYLVSMEKKIRNGETTVKRFEYNEKGNLIQDSIGGLGGPSEKNQYTYNDKKQLIKKVFKRYGKDPLKHLYQYDTKGNRVEESIYGKKHLKKKFLYAYDEKGHLIKELEEYYQHGRYRDSHSYETTYGYDEKNNLVEKERERLAGGDWRKYTYWYDDQGNMVKKRTQIENGYREMDKIYHYDHDHDIVQKHNDSGLVIEEIKNPGGQYPLKTVYAYRADQSLAEKNKYFSDGRRIQYFYDANENLVKEFYHPDSEGDTYQTILEHTGIKLKQILH